MNPVRHFAVLNCALISWVGLANPVAAEVLSSAVGHNTIVCAGGSDTVVSVPFHRPPGIRSAVAGNPVVSASSATISYQAERILSEGELSDEPHYLRFTSGTRSGRSYSVSSHGPDSITIEVGDDDLAGVTSDDSFQVIPYWTLASLFPKETQSTIHVSGGKLAPTRKSRVLFFDEVSQGFGLAPDQVYFLTAEGWFRSDRGFPAADDAIIPPGKAFVVRHQADDLDTVFTPRHEVFRGDHSIALRTHSTGRQDNSAALVRPVPVKLSDLDLSSSFSDSASTSAGNRSDELLLYDNLTAGFNKPPATTYFKVAGQWHRDDGSSYPVADDDIISPATGILIRKTNNPSGAIFHWLNTPRY
ncbi:MAG: TIGR02597 family protein [Verrucomicrobiales bacterium]|nr:TIGR02597 family protein [Verrucomicrobiales bacterium]